MLKRYESIISNYEKWHPGLYAKTVECKPSGYYSILACLADGSKIEYNDLDNTIRDVTRFYNREANNTLDEESWKKEFGRRLRHLIAERGISQEELSDLTGISRQMLSRYVRGTSTPSGYILTRLSEVLDCDIRDLTRFGYIDE